MSESNLRKEFSKRDVQRMRNIIGGNAGGATGTQLGYSKQYTEYEEGDIWEENGRKWTIKNGIKQTITKFDELKKLFVLPISCPNCSNPMKTNDLNKKMYSIHKMCFDCVVEMEGKLKAQGKYEEYASNLLNLNKNHMLDDFEVAVD